MNEYFLLPLASLPFPNINPILVQIGPLAVHWYGIGYIVGILFAWWYAKRLAANPKLWPDGVLPMKPEDLDDFIVWAAIGVVLGGRTGYVLFYDLARYIAHPLDIFAVWQGGMSFHGGLLGVILAIPVGFVMGWYKVARSLIEPYLQFFRMIPPLAIIPLAIVTMGIDETPKIFVIFLASFLASVVATYQGVISVDKTMINAARVLGAKDMTIFLRVIIPASTPFILVGVRIGLGSAWATLVAAELIAAQSGLGFRMQQAQLYYDLPTIFVSLITIGLLGLAMDRILLVIERRLTVWQERV
ncbi:ABC transporter permease subunit [Mesorhizobium sp. M8A.F.Ca.ET.023.01.1.1]|nr:ABC transporter permease subunit [Mesorhizobium sp. M8A.F.Ca.ET.023.01.1.1]